MCGCAVPYAPPNFQPPLGRGGRPGRLRSGRRHCSSPVCPLPPGDGDGPPQKGPRGERRDDARLRRRGWRRQKAAAGAAPVTAGGGRAAPMLATPPRQSRGMRGRDRGSLAGRGWAASVRGSGCPAPVGAAREPRARRRRGGAAGTGVTGGHPSLWVSRVLPPDPRPSPIRPMCCFLKQTKPKHKPAWSARVVPPGLPPARIICLYSPLKSASYIMAFEHMST